MLSRSRRVRARTDRLARVCTSTQTEAEAAAQSGSPRAPKRRVSFDNAKKMLQKGKNKWQSLRERTASTVIMIASVIGILSLGHAYCIVLIFGVANAMVQELFTFVANTHGEEVGVENEALRRTTMTLRWHLYWTAQFALYGRFAKYLWLGFFSAEDWNELLTEGAENPHNVVAWLAMHHSFLSFCSYIGGVVYFVLTLRKGKYEYQFSQFAWTHMILFVAIMMEYFNMANLMEGMIWFIFPLFLVIVNDIMAYIFGKMFGRTPLIKISPNKTWEGFLGAAVATIGCAPVCAYYMQKLRYLTCPPSGDVYFRGVFYHGTWCQVAEPFITADRPLSKLFGSVAGPIVTRITGVASVRCSMFVLHAFALGTFASAIAPFGGFFASGFKRAFKIKDFAETIPGHGGITDRMDCHVMNSCFSHLYLSNFVQHVGGAYALGMMLTKIELVSDEHIVELYKAIKRMVATRGIPID